MGWYNYFTLLEKYGGDLTKATPQEMKHAAWTNPANPVDAMELARKKYAESKIVSVPEDEEEEISPKSDALGGSTDLEGALVKILFTPKTLMHNAYCSGPCGKKKKLPLGVSEKCADCGGQYL